MIHIYYFSFIIILFMIQMTRRVFHEPCSWLIFIGIFSVWGWSHIYMSYPPLTCMLTPPLKTFILDINGSGSLWLETLAHNYVRATAGCCVSHPPGILTRYNIFDCFQISISTPRGADLRRHLCSSRTRTSRSKWPVVTTWPSTPSGTAAPRPARSASTFRKGTKRRN